MEEAEEADEAEEVKEAKEAEGERRQESGPEQVLRIADAAMRPGCV